MKGSSLIISIVALVAVGVLYFFHFTGDSQPIEQIPDNKHTRIQEGVNLRIAYVKADSVIINYDLAQDLHDDFSKKQDAYNSEFSTKRQSFEREAAAFQEKLQRGGFLTEQRAIQERDKLVSKEQEIMKLDQDLSGRLAELQTSNNKQILDSLLNYLQEFNRHSKYDYILNGGDVLVGNEAYNITREVVVALNQRYAKKTASK